MAMKTNVPAEFERRYNSEMQPPEDVIKQMRREITNMRKDLIRKQNRLENNKLYKSNPALKEELQETKVRNLKTPGEVQNTYFKMRQYEKSNRTSVTGMRTSAKKSLKTLQLGKYGDTLGKVIRNEQDLAAYGEFMDWLRDNYSTKALGYQRVLNWYVENADKAADSQIGKDLKNAFDKWAAE